MAGMRRRYRRNPTTGSSPSQRPPGGKGKLRRDGKPPALSNREDRQSLLFFPNRVIDIAHVLPSHGAENGRMDKRPIVQRSQRELLKNHGSIGSISCRRCIFGSSQCRFNGPRKAWSRSLRRNADISKPSRACWRDADLAVRRISLILIATVRRSTTRTSGGENQCLILFRRESGSGGPWSGRLASHTLELLQPALLRPRRYCT